MYMNYQRRLVSGSRRKFGTECLCQIRTESSEQLSLCHPTFNKGGKHFGNKLVPGKMIYVYIKDEIGELHCLLPFEVQELWELLRWCRALLENAGNREELPRLHEKKNLNKLT